MLHPLRYKLNKTWSLNYYSLPLSLSPPSLPTSIPSYLPSFLPLSFSLPLIPILPPLSLRHTISIPFSLFFPTLLCSSSPLFLHVFARHSFFFLVPILSFSLRRTWIRSWLFAHIYTNVEAIFAIQSICVIPAMLHWHYHSLTQTMQSVNWCSWHSWRLPNGFTATLECRGWQHVTCTWQLFLLTNDWRVQRPIAWNRWGQNVVLPVNSARPTSSISWFVLIGVECSRRCTFDAQCSVTVGLN